MSEDQDNQVEEVKKPNSDEKAAPAEPKKEKTVTSPEAKEDEKPAKKE